jgi:hypothetical protein
MLCLAAPASTGVPPVGLGPLGVLPAHLESRVHGNMRCMTPTADVPTLSILLDAHDDRSAMWFRLNRRAGSVILHHRHIGPVLIREWSREMDGITAAI